MTDFKELKKNNLQYIEFFESNDLFGKSLGYKIVELTKEHLTTKYTVKPEHFNPNGILHGGALYSVMDSSQGAFIHYILEDKYKFAATGTSTIKYLAPVTQGVVTIHTNLEKQDGRKLFISSVAKDEKSKTVAQLDEIWIATPQN